MYNLVEYSRNCWKTTGSLWNYYRDEANICPPNDYNTNPIKNSASFKYKNSITEKTLNNDDNNDENDNRKKNKQDDEIVVPLKHLSNFWRTLDITLINSEKNLILTWSENCVLIDISTQAAVPTQGNNSAKPAMNAPAGATFKGVCSSSHFIKWRW